MIETLFASDDFNRPGMNPYVPPTVIPQLISTGQPLWVSNGADMPQVNFVGASGSDVPWVELGTGSGGGPDCGAVWSADDGLHPRTFSRLLGIGGSFDGGVHEVSQSGPCVLSSGHLPFTKNCYMFMAGQDASHVYHLQLIRINAGSTTVLVDLSSTPLPPGVNTSSLTIYAEVKTSSIELYVAVGDVILGSYSDTSAFRIGTGKFGIMSCESDGVHKDWWINFEAGYWNPGTPPAAGPGVQANGLATPPFSSHWRLRHQTHPRRVALAAAMQNRTDGTASGEVPIRYGYHALIKRGMTRRDAIALAMEGVHV